MQDSPRYKAIMKQFKLTIGDMHIPQQCIHYMGNCRTDGKTT